MYLCVCVCEREIVVSVTATRCGLTPMVEDGHYTDHRYLSSSLVVQVVVVVIVLVGIAVTPAANVKKPPV